MTSGLTAQEKYALVIGNGAYGSVTRLKNPTNDAADMSAVLKDLGVKVDTLTNASLGEMEDAVVQAGTGLNGLFTSQLLRNLKTPGLEIAEVFKRTGADVKKASGTQQIPAVYNQFFDSAYLAGMPKAEPVNPGLVSMVRKWEPRISFDGRVGLVYFRNDPLYSIQLRLFHPDSPNRTDPFLDFLAPPGSISPVI